MFINFPVVPFDTEFDSAQNLMVEIAGQYCKEAERAQQQTSTIPVFCFCDFEQLCSVSFRFAQDQPTLQIVKKNSTW